ncbi:hypothetical protein ACFLXO_00220 [Chloroflexota bacterium]
MKNEQPSSREVVIKEYPRSTRWIEGRRIVGEGNLILTSERLVFLNRAALSQWHAEKIKEMETAPMSEGLDFALTLHKKNFQIPLSSVLSADRCRIGLLPFPRFYLRITYLGGSKHKEKSAAFMFTIPLLKGFFQLEFTTVMGWVWMIRKVLLAKKQGLKR